MSITIGLIVLAFLIGFVCYMSRCSTSKRSFPTEISKRL